MIDTWSRYCTVSYRIGVYLLQSLYLYSRVLYPDGAHRYKEIPFDTGQGLFTLLSAHLNDFFSLEYIECGR